MGNRDDCSGQSFFNMAFACTYGECARNENLNAVAEELSLTRSLLTEQAVKYFFFGSCRGVARGCGDAGVRAAPGGAC